MNPFVERHQEEIAGVLSCFDRGVITGMLPDIGHAGAVTQWLGSQGIRLLDYPQWAAPLREELHLGHKLAANFQDEVGNDFSTRIQGTRIRHFMGPASLKLYDKFGLRACGECTVQR